MATRITVRARGPLVVQGDIELIDENGERIDTAGRSKVLLCRCGASGHKPLCDGAHNRIDFDRPDPPNED